MSHSYTKLLYHIVFGTKKRQPWLVEEIQPDLYGILGGLVREEGGTALTINGMLEHVHILARLRQDRAISDVIRAREGQFVELAPEAVERPARSYLADRLQCIYRQRFAGWGGPRIHRHAEGASPKQDLRGRASGTASQARY